MKSYVLEVREGIINWLESIRWKEEGWGKWKYNARMIRRYGLIPSANAIVILHSLKALDNISEEQKQEAVSFFQFAQDPVDGYFKDPLVTEEDRVENALHSWEDIWGQMGAAASALEVLGAKTLYSMPEASFADLRTVNIEEWILSLNWENPWHVGERFSRAIQAYVKDWRESKSNDISVEDPILKRVFKILEDKILDTETGMPVKRGCKDPSVAMAGLFKIMSGYRAVKREVPSAEKAIDFTLNLQHPHGEFGFGGNMCINWDSLWVLRELDRQLEGKYRHDDIVKAGNLLADCLMKQYYKPDGGFAFCREHCWSVHHSIKISNTYPISDVMGTIMCLRCLEYADEWNEN